MSPEEDASSDPGGRAFDLQKDIDERFPPSVHVMGVIVEARDGDFLTQKPLWELYRNTERLRSADQAGELAPPGLDAQTYLFPYYNAEIERPVVGVYTLADAVQDVLAQDPRLDTTLEKASDNQVKLALHQLFSAPGGEEFRDSLSVMTTSEPGQVAGQEIEVWHSPALLTFVVADNDKLGGGSLQIGLGGGSRQKERFNRNVQEVLRGGQESYRLWGIAIDVSLEAGDESGIAGPFIMFTVIAVLIVVGVSLRSYWAVALTGAGLGLLMIWLKGISNLIGLKSGLVIDFIVPIAMISLGVDYAIHAIHRYDEERGKGSGHRLALRLGFAGVLSALVLAMLTDAVAFLSNITSGIESIVGFGIGAGVAVFSSLIILGVVAPLAMMRIDLLKGDVAEQRANPRRRWMAALGQALVMGLAAAFSGVGIIFLIAIWPEIGIVLIGGFIVLGILAPLVVRVRLDGRGRRAVVAASQVVSGAATQHETTATRESVTHAILTAIVVSLARRRAIVLPLAAVVTVAALFFALRLEATFDAKDFFDSSSDFVVSLDKLDEHVGETAGEPALVYIKGDLSQPQSLEAIRLLLDRMKGNPYLARNAGGELNLSPSVFTFLGRITRDEYARSRVEEVTGVAISDADEDGVPDTQAQIRAAYDYMVRYGVPLDESTLAYSPSRVRETLFHDSSGTEEDVTLLELGIPGSRQQSVVTAAREAMEKDLGTLVETSSISTAGLTGSPFTREAGLNATTRTLNTSLPSSAALCFLVILLFVGSLRYALVTIIPIGLVVAWLYAFMYLAGFALNYVTAVIASVSIGVGIDYSVHVTQRFREELAKVGDRMQALEQAARGTGIALLGSAASSIVGFGIMGFAPMPMFSAYGILTAVMILMATAAALLVLPSLLMLVAPEKKEG
jgi:predicted RND superfamily exporter protein